MRRTGRDGPGEAPGVTMSDDTNLYARLFMYCFGIKTLPARVTPGARPARRRPGSDR
ncbi:hypothetical protein BRI6_2476 [plant metagenome]|uniref:Uncharacterized protein n=1 Tax=plant metagenome TaxID=1297885 RepID=A0A484RYZ9_9ZZZZ